MADLTGLYPFPTGWYAVAFSKDLAAGDVQTVRCLGKEIVLYRTADGAAVAVDPYCPHLGAHLGHGGVVDGASLRCPFHGWSFGADGQCESAPGCSKLPRASLTRYPLVEQDDVVSIFHDAHGDGREPFPYPPLGGEGFTESRYVEWTVRSHPQEVCENTVDMAHLFPVHSVVGAHVHKKPHVDGTHLNVILRFTAPGDIIGMPGEDNDVELDVILHGLGRIVSRTHVLNRDVHARQAIYCTPVDGDRIVIRGVVNTKVTPDPEFTRELAELFYSSFVHDFAKDFPIWENKRYLARPVLSAADGPVSVYRKWCRQFSPAQVSAPSEPMAAKPARRSLLTLVRERYEETAQRARDAFARATPTAPAAEPTKTTAPSARRVTSAEEYFATLDQRFVPAGSEGVDAVFQWKLSGDRALERYAVVRGGAMELHPGAHASPTVTIAMDESDYVRMVNREIDGAWAFTSGRGKLSGSIPMAMKMRQIFPQ